MGRVDVRFHPDAEAERRALAPRERVAVDHVIEKLSALGIKLGFPHSSKVVGADNLRSFALVPAEAVFAPFTDGSVRPLLLPRSVPKHRATRPDTNAPFVSGSNGSPRSSDRQERAACLEMSGWEE